MALPEFTMRQLLEAGVHFGHQTHRWNPKMEPLHLRRPQQHPHHRPVADRSAAAPGAAGRCRDTVAKGGRVLFVGTKRQASEPIADAAKRSAQYYVNHRWLGGTLTNWQTISQLDRAAARARRACSTGERQGLTKKELLQPRPRAREAGAVAGRHQGHGRHSRPDVRDRHQQGSDRHPGGASSSASRWSRSSTPTAIPDGSTFRSRATTTRRARSQLYCDLIADAALDGIARSKGAPGVDLGAAEEAPVEPALEAAPDGRQASAGA